MKFLQALLFVCLCAGPVAAENLLVVPFFNNSGSNNVDWIGESIAQSVRETLASRGVLTLDRAAREEAFRRLSVKPYAVLTRATVMRLAESLDAEQVIYGTYTVTTPQGQERSKSSIEIQAQVIDLRNARRGPEYSETGSLEDLARLQAHLAWQTLQFVLGGKGPTEEQFLQQLNTIRVDALESFVRSLLVNSEEQKMKYLSQAIRLEPRYSRANFEIGRLQFKRKSYRPAAESLQKVQPSDIYYREATFILGLCRYYLGEFAGAEQAFKIVAQQVPLNEVLNNLAAAQSRLNQATAALENFRKALEGDPGDPTYHFNVGYVLLQLGDVEGAADRFRAVLDRNRDDTEATTLLGRALKKDASRTPSRSEGLERLKENYQESAYWQLKAVLEPKR